MKHIGLGADSISYGTPTTVTQFFGLSRPLFWYKLALDTYRIL